jgi:hypothetical protein
MRVINYILFIFAFIAITGTASADYYYADITITDNPGIDDYQTCITLDHRDGMASDFSNIRFFDGVSSIPYWIESKTDSSSAVVWIPISEGSDIECRWGVSGETASESSISDVMDFGDEFLGSALDTLKWSTGYSEGSSGGAYTVSNGELTTTLTGSTAISYHVRSLDNFGTSYVLEFKAKYPHYTATEDIGRTSSIGFANADAATDDDASYIAQSSLTGAYKCLRTCDEGSVTYKSNIGVDPTSYHKYKIARGTSSVMGYVDGTLDATSTTNIPDESCYISSGLRVWASTSTSNVIDYIFVRKYAATEPTTTVGITQIYSDDEPTLAHSNHVRTYQDTTITINTAEDAPVVWTVDGVVNSETGQSLSISFEKAGNHYVSADHTDNTTVTVKRALATGSIEELDEGNFENITIDLDDGDWEGFAGDSMASFTDLIGRSFWLILFVLPFALNWKKQEGLTIPSIMALVVGVLVIGFIPATYHTIITVAVILAFAVNLNGLTKDRM